MMYSFSLNAGRSLVFNDNLLYSVGVVEQDKDLDSQYEYECYLSDKEQFVLEYLIKNASRRDPVSPLSIEAAYRETFSEKISTHSLINIIASLRKKYKWLVAQYDGTVNDTQLVVNAFGRGYYIDLDRLSNQQLNAKLATHFNRYQPSLLSMLKTFADIYHRSFLNKAVWILFSAGLVVAFLYGLQIWQLSSMIDKYSRNHAQVADKMLALGCDDRSIITEFDRSLSLDSALFVSRSQACLIDRDGIRQLSVNETKLLLERPEFIYMSAQSAEAETRLIGRISKRSFEHHYHNHLWPILVSSIVISNQGEDVVSIGVPFSGIRISAVEFENGTRVFFYSDALFLEWFIMALFLLLARYGKTISQFGVFCCDWSSSHFKLEKVIDTHRDTVLYYEVLTNLKRRSIVQYIDNLVSNQWMTFHTIMIIKTIAKARSGGVLGVYGVNICPSSLLNSQFANLEKYLRLLPAKQVVLELTESAKLHYNKEIYANVNKLKRLGFTIALDDFGTGQSNIEIVSKICPDYLKVDMGFVLGIESEQHKRELLMTLLDIGRLSGCQVIQEGVETRSQQDILHKMGYRLQQGYLYT
ncbi:EAL domain-containing protein [Vibrio ostreicida]|uniref:EAL domain-containing protein n=1 Tax=Vibrio ostreicida TaxID=526588 RepID=UPI00097061E0|nr:EAL domain-containing protein [Vibrio ostreicida]